MTELTNRYDFLLFFDVQDGNPNGDPDAGNMPRIDPETGQGLVTDVCLKRKIRNYVMLTKEGIAGYDVFVKEKGILNLLIERAYDEVGIDINGKTAADGKRKKAGKSQGEETAKGRQQMCQTYFDVRTFGAVMSTGPNAGQVRGPIQLTFSRSVDPIVSLEHTITRVAVATEKEADDQGGDNRTMGRKNTVPYGLYRCAGFISPALAKQTGFSEDDLSVFFEATKNMFEHDRSAAKGLMSLQKMVVFRHDSELGNASAHSLFDLVTVERANQEMPARSFGDYVFNIDESSLPTGINIDVTG